jgi:hypothetical protein
LTKRSTAAQLVGLVPLLVLIKKTTSPAKAVALALKNPIVLFVMGCTPMPPPIPITTVGVPGLLKPDAGVPGGPANGLG